MVTWHNKSNKSNIELKTQLVVIGNNVNSNNNNNNREKCVLVTHESIN